MENQDNEKIDVHSVEFLSNQLQIFNHEYDTLEEKQKIKAEELRTLRERSKKGEDLSVDIDTAREEIQDIAADLDSLYKRIRNTENKIKEQTQQQGEKLPNETTIATVETESSENLADKKQGELLMVDSQKKFSEKIKNALNFLHERNNSHLQKIVSDESFSAIELARKLLNQDMFDVQHSKKALEMLVRAFENPVPNSGGQIRENTDSLDNFIYKCNSLVESLSEYQGSITKSGRSEFKELLPLISRSKDMIEAKKLRIQMMRSHL